MSQIKTPILKALCFKPLQSVSEIATRINRSIPNVTKILNELSNEGLVTNVGLAPSTGGRRAIQYKLEVNNLPLILSIAMDQYYSSISLLNFDHSYFTAVKTIKNPLNEPEAFDMLLALISEVITSADSRKIFAIGITTPGFVDFTQGINTSYPIGNPFYDIKKIIEDKFGIQTFLENDSAAIAIAEKKFGQHQESKDMLVVNLNWGIGLGMIFGGKLFRGHSGFAGEFSHIPLSDQGKLCACGKRGCLEVEGSLLSAVDDATARLANGEISLLTGIYNQRGYITGEWIIDAAKQGDQLALSAIENMAYIIGKGLATLIHIINPEHIILSGRGARLGDILPDTIHTSLRKYTIEKLRLQTKLSVSEIENAQLLGGACLAIKNAAYDTLFTKNLTKPNT